MLRGELMNRKGILAFGVVFLISLTLTFLNIKIANSQGIILEAKYVEHISIDNINDPVWDEAVPVIVPLSAQSRITAPRGGGAIKSLTARALHDGEAIYLKLTWKDDTEDVSFLRQEDFRDSVAVQFPVKLDNGKLPSVCMGQLGAAGNIWHWKADWNEEYLNGFKDIDNVYPNMMVNFYPREEEEIFYPAKSVGNLYSVDKRTTPVENLISTEYGTITPSAEQNVIGKGEWKNGEWTVVMSRSFTTPYESDAQFGVGKRTAISFAAWDGSAGERDGLKSTSTWIDLEISEPLPQKSPLDTIVVFTLFAAIVIFVVFIIIRTVT